MYILSIIFAYFYSINTFLSIFNFYTFLEMGQIMLLGTLLKHNV